MRDFSLDSTFVLLNTGAPTHFHIQSGYSSPIDLALCSPEVVADFDWFVEEDLHGSDHHPISLTITRPDPVYREPKFDQRRADWDRYNDETRMDHIMRSLPLSPIDRKSHSKHHISKTNSSSISPSPSAQIYATIPVIGGRSHSNRKPPDTERLKSKGGTGPATHHNYSSPTFFHFAMECWLIPYPLFRP